MYADRVEAAAKLSIKERLNGNSAADSISRRQVAGKRQRQDDKWEHDLYDDNEPQLSRRRVDPRDLRLKLQRKSLKKVSQSGRAGVRDLREKLSRTMNSQPVNADPPKPKPEAAKPARKSVVVEASGPEPKRTATSAVKKKDQQKAETSVEGFLESLGLDKYVITFKAEEVDMSALVHMTDQDLKALGIPMLWELYGASPYPHVQELIFLGKGPKKKDTSCVGIKRLTSGV